MKLPDSPPLREAIHDLNENQFPVLRAAIQKKPDALNELAIRLKTMETSEQTQACRDALRELMGNQPRTSQ